MIREIDIGPAVEQAAKIDSGALQVDGIDLEIAPIERAVRIVMIDFAIAARVFRPLHGECNAARGAELITRIESANLLCN